MRQLSFLFVVVLLAGCSEASEPDDAPPDPAGVADTAADTIALEGYDFEPGVDLYGYFLPEEPVGAGTFVLGHLMTAGAEEFERHETGVAELPPIHFEFHDTASGRVVSEEGYESWRVTRRVEPEAYRVTPERIAFAGEDSVLGTVRFRGRLDAGALRAAQTEGLGDDLPILVGDLRVGDRTFEDVAFTWTVGD